MKFLTEQKKVIWFLSIGSKRQRERKGERTSVPGGSKV